MDSQELLRLLDIAEEARAAAQIAEAALKAEITRITQDRNGVSSYDAMVIFLEALREKDIDTAIAMNKVIARYYIMGTEDIRSQVEAMRKKARETAKKTARGW